MLKFKDGVSLIDFDTGMFKCVDICNGIFNNQGVDCTVTSTEGLGINLRAWHIHDVEAIAVKLRRALGVMFDVTIGKTHIHIEKKSKGKKKCPIPKKQ